LHHHDVVHFALEEVQKEIEEGHEDEVVTRLRNQLGIQPEQTQSQVLSVTRVWRKVSCVEAALCDLRCAVRALLGSTGMVIVHCGILCAGRCRRSGCGFLVSDSLAHQDKYTECNDQKINELCSGTARSEIGIALLFRFGQSRIVFAFQSDIPIGKIDAV